MSAGLTAAAMAMLSLTEEINMTKADFKKMESASAYECCEPDMEERRGNIAEEESTTKESTTTNARTVKTFRFTHDPEVMDAVTRFAKIHQYDDRHEYKEAWKEWCDENREMLETEARRLSAAGYEGDVYDKLFKSGRYYFRNKRAEKIAPAERKKYVGLGRDTLRAMDEFILSEMLPVDGQSVISPATAFNLFCERSQSVLRVEISALLNDHGLDDHEVADKIKKTFKNRYFQKVRKVAIRQSD